MAILGANTLGNKKRIVWVSMFFVMMFSLKIVLHQNVFEGLISFIEQQSLVDGFLIQFILNNLD